MKQLSKMIERPFRQWISTETWHTSHPLDEERFYRFVWSVAQFSRRPPTEEDIRNLITTKWAEKLEREYLEKSATNYANLYATLLEFAKVRNKGQPFLPSEFE